MGGASSCMSPLTSPTLIPSVTHSCSVAAGAVISEGGGSGDRNDRYQIGVHQGMGDQRCVLCGKEVA